MEKSITKNALAISLKEILVEKAFGNISVEDICKNAGVSRRTFYRYFLDKYELLNWVYEWDMQAGIQNGGQGDEENKEYLINMCVCFSDNRDFYKRALNVEGQNSFCEYCQDKIQECFTKEYIRMGKSDSMFLRMAECLARAIYDAAREWLENDAETSPEDFVEELYSTMEVFGGYMYRESLT